MQDVMQQETTSESRSTIYELRDFFFNRHAADQVFRSLWRWQLKIQMSSFFADPARTTLSQLGRRRSPSVFARRFSFISLLSEHNLNNKSRF